MLLLAMFADLKGAQIGAKEFGIQQQISLLKKAKKKPAFDGLGINFWQALTQNAHS